MKELLSSLHENFSIQDRTISIYYGNDYLNIQCVNFVLLNDKNPVEETKVNKKIEIHNLFSNDF